MTNDDDRRAARFAIGDRVQRAEPRSYLFPGIVIGPNLKLDGKTWLYSVECIAPGVEGMVHEFTERALEPLSADWTPDLAAERRGMERAAGICDELASSGANKDDWTITRDLAFCAAAAAIRAEITNEGA